MTNDEKKLGLASAIDDMNSLIAHVKIKGRCEETKKMAMAASFRLIEFMNKLEKDIEAENSEADSE